MKVYKRLVSFILSLVLMCGIVVAPAIAADDTRPSSVNNPGYYTDIAGSWAATALEIAVRNGILNGVSATRVEPNKPISRAEMAAFMVRVFEPTSYADISRFVDVSLSDWYYDTVSQAVGMGVIQGDGNMARPNDTITKQEAAVILARAFNLYGYSTDLRQFVDAGSIAAWAYDSMEKCTAAGIVRANSDRQLLPLREITRAEFAYMLANAVTTYSSSRVYSVGTGSVQSVMVSDMYPVLRSVSVLDNVYIGSGVRDTQITLTNVDVAGTLYALNGSKLILKDSYISTLVIASRQSDSFSIELDANSSIDKIVVQDCGSKVVLTGDISELEVATSTTEVHLEQCNVKTLTATTSRPTVRLDNISVIEDNHIDNYTYYAKDAMADLSLHLYFDSRHTIVGDVELIGYNPVRLYNTYGKTVSDFVDNLSLRQSLDGKVRVTCDFYDVFVRANDRDRSILLDGYYLPIRIRVTDIRDSFTLSVNGVDQGRVPNSSFGDTCLVNILLPFDEDNTTATIQLIPVRGSHYDEACIDLEIDNTSRFYAW